MIHVEQLTFDYAAFRALNAVSFHVPPESITALVGPNGAGKTTLLNCLAGLQRPLFGRILIDGLDIQEQPREVHRIIGYLPDFFGLYEGLTVTQCFEYACLAHAVPIEKMAENVERTLDRVNLVHKRDARIYELSRGMRQRVAIGQSIIHNPRVLMLDEPASGLDPESRASLSKLFLQLKSEGMTLLVSSHILFELDDYADHLLSLKHGHLVDNQQTPKIAQLKRRLVFHVSDLTESQYEFLKTLVEERNLQRMGDQFSFEFDGSQTDQVNYLRKMIKAGLAVSEFYVKRVSLQEKYLDQLRGPS